MRKMRRNENKEKRTFGGIESCDLDDVVALRPSELVHLLLDAKITELAHVIL
jgi:hypothetical protein